MKPPKKPAETFKSPEHRLGELIYNHVRDWVIGKDRGGEERGWKEFEYQSRGKHFDQGVKNKDLGPTQKAVEKWRRGETKGKPANQLRALIATGLTAQAALQQLNAFRQEVGLPRLTRTHDEILDDATPTSVAPPKPNVPHPALPSLPRNYVNRDSFLAPLRELVLAGKDTGVTSVKTAGLRGIGGLGKSVLAKALLHDQAIAARFEANRFWCDVGQARDALTLQRQLLRAVKGRSQDIESIADGSAQLRAAFANKPSLIVVDDIWTLDQASAFSDIGPDATLVVTTRFQKVLDRLGAIAQPLDVLTLGQARELLAAWANVDLDILPVLADEVIGECGSLPLALGCFGAAIARSKMSWEEGLEALKDRDLGDLVEVLDDYDGKEGAFGAIDLSFNTLDPMEQTALARCAVFPEDVAIPISAFAALWHDLPGLHSTRAVRRLCQNLEATSLMMPDVGDKRLPCWRFHDLVGDYLQSRLNNHADVHAKVAKGYHQAHKENWPPDADDGYFYDHFARHLALSGDQQALERTLFDLGWLNAKLQRRGPRSLVSDFSVVPVKVDTSLVGRALRMSSHVLNKFPEQLHVQIFGRLGYFADMTRIEKLTNQANLNRVAGTLTATNAPHLSPPGTLLETSAEHGAAVMGTLVLDDGQRIVSWSDDSTLRVWDLETGDCLKTLILDTPATGGLVNAADDTAIVFNQLGRPLVIPLAES